MSKYTFNIRPVAIGLTIDQPSEELIANTLGLWSASLDDAVRYGGDVTRHALSVMPLRGDRRFTIVDVKVHMLMSGQCPSIPGWHTDGVPRRYDGAPFGGPPNLPMQRRGLDEDGRELRPPRYHLLVTGTGCPTEFVTGPLTLDIPHETATSPELYASITRAVNKINPPTFLAPSCTVLTWDWWNLHRATVATVREWRYLIRVTETDLRAPETDLRRVLRSQQNVYIPGEYGW